MLSRLVAFRPLPSAARRGVSSRVVIKGLPLDIRRDDVFRVCEEFGRVSSLFLNVAQSGKHCLATVSFKSTTPAIALVDELNETNLFEKKVSVVFSTRLDESKTPPRPQS